MKAAKRPYRQKRRAEGMAETRQKIVEAALELHQEKGLAATSMRDVAEQAGVGTVTVYRHFADEQTLIGACSGAYFERHPFPDLDEWRTVADPVGRLLHGLTQAYAYHRKTEAMMASVLGEVRNTPAIEPYDAFWQQAAAVLLEPWPESARRGGGLKAAFVLALQFETWQLLTGQEGLSDDDAIALMLRLTCDCP